MIEMRDLLRELAMNAIHEVDVSYSVEKFIEIAQIQMELDGGHDLFAACEKVRARLGAMTLGVDEEFYWLVSDFYGFKVQPALCGIHLSSVDVLVNIDNVTR